MISASTSVRIRQLDDTDLGDIGAIDESISGLYRPKVWEDRVSYYLRRDPDGCFVAELDGRVIGFMLGEVRSGDFGLEEPTGWIEVIGVDPKHRGHAAGRKLADALLAHFRSRGAVSVRTLVDESMPGIAEFFGALGFAPESLRPFVKKL